MVFHVKDDMRIEAPVMSIESVGSPGDLSRKSSNNGSTTAGASSSTTVKLSDLKTKSSKRSAAYSKDQVKQLIELFPEISHLRRRAETENLEELFPDALAELVEILGSTKKVEQELFRRKESREKETRRAAEREARKTVGVRFAASTNESAVFECLESEALRRAGIAEQALANATAARDKVHKLYKGLIATTNPVKCDNSGAGDLSTIGSASHTTPRGKQQQKQTSQQPSHQQQQRSVQTLPADRWEALRKEARVIVTKRLLAGWKMSAEACKGGKCNKCPLLLKDNILQCVVCKGNGSGQDGLYHNAGGGDGNNNTKKQSSSSTTASASVEQPTTTTKPPLTEVGNHQSTIAITTNPSGIHEILTPLTLDSQDTPSNIMGKITKRIEKNQQQAAEAATPAAMAGSRSMAFAKEGEDYVVDNDNDDEPEDEFESLLKQQRQRQMMHQKKNESVIVYDIVEDSSTTHEDDRMDQVDSEGPPQLQHTSTYVAEDDHPFRDARSSSINGINQHRHNFPRRQDDGRKESEEIIQDIQSRARESVIPGLSIQLDDKEKQDLLEEVHSIISRSAAASSTGGTSAKRSRVGREILLKTAQGWSLIDASCNKCEMPLLTDPTNTKELCVFCEVKRMEQETYIHIDEEQERCTPSEITDTVYGERSPERSIGMNRPPPASVTVVCPPDGTVGSHQHQSSINNRDQQESEYNSVNSPSYQDHQNFQDQTHPSALLSPGFDAKSMFPIRHRIDVNQHQPHDQQDEPLTTVASPEFDDKTMFPFLDERSEAREDTSTEPSFSSRIHGLENPHVRGILARTAGELGSRSQLQTSHVEAQHYVRRNPIAGLDPRARSPPASRYPSDSNHTQGQHIATTLQEGQRIYNQAKERIRNAAASISIYDVPYADNEQNNLFEEGQEGAMYQNTAASAGTAPYTHHIHDNMELWNPVTAVYSTRVESREMPQESYVGAATEGRDAPAQNHFGRKDQIKTRVADKVKGGRQLNQSSRRANIPVGGPSETNNVNGEMKLRVTENIKAGRMNGYSRTNKKVRIVPDAKPAILPPPMESSLSSPRKNAKRLRDSISPRLTVLDDSFKDTGGGVGSSHPPSTNFYEQLQSRAQYLSWPFQSSMDAHESNNGKSSGNDKHHVNSFGSTTSEQNNSACIQIVKHMTAGKGQPEYFAPLETKAIVNGRASTAEPPRNQSQQDYSSADSAKENQFFPEMSVMSELASIKGPLPSVREIPNEMSPTASNQSDQSKVDQRSESSKVIKQNVSLVSSLGVPGIEEGSDNQGQRKEPTSASHLNEPTKGTSTVTTEITNSVYKCLMDDELSASSTTKDLGRNKSGSTASAESTVGNSHCLLNSIRMPRQCRTSESPAQEARSDPPDTPLHHVAVQKSRVGMDPEEERAMGIKELSPSLGGTANPTIHRGKGGVGYAIVIPDGFDLTDEEQLRNLLMSAKKQQIHPLELPDEASASASARLSAKQQQMHQLELPAVAAASASPRLSVDTSGPALSNVNVGIVSNVSELRSPVSSASQKSKSPRKHRPFNDRRSSRIAQSRTFGSNSPNSKHVQASLPSLQSSRTQDSPQDVAKEDEWDGTGVSTIRSPKSSVSSPRSRPSHGSNRSRRARSRSRDSKVSKLEEKVIDILGGKVDRSTYKQSPTRDNKTDAKWSQNSQDDKESDKIKSPDDRVDVSKIKSTSISDTSDAMKCNDIADESKRKPSSSETSQQKDPQKADKDSETKSSQNDESGHSLKPEDDTSQENAADLVVVEANCDVSEPEFIDNEVTHLLPMQTNGLQQDAKNGSPPNNERRGPVGTDPDVRPHSSLPPMDYGKSSSGYLSSLIESIRTPARVWDTEVPREGRSDPPDSAEILSPKRSIRAAPDPDDCVTGTESIHINSFHIRLQHMEASSPRRGLLDPEESGATKAVSPSQHGGRKGDSEALARKAMSPSEHGRRRGEPEAPARKPLSPSGHAGGKGQHKTVSVNDPSTESQSSLNLPLSVSTPMTTSQQNGKKEEKITRDHNSAEQHQNSDNRGGGRKTRTIPFVQQLRTIPVVQQLTHVIEETERVEPVSLPAAKQHTRVIERTRRVEPVSLNFDRALLRAQQIRLAEERRQSMPNWLAEERRQNAPKPFQHSPNVAEHKRVTAAERVRELTMDDIKLPSHQRYQTFPRVESTCLNKARSPNKINRDSALVASAAKPNHGAPSDESIDLTPTLEPRVQSPYFDGVSPLEEPPPIHIVDEPEAKSDARIRNPWASGKGATGKGMKSNRRLPSVGDQRHPPPRHSRKDRLGPFSSDESQPPSLLSPRAPSLGEQEASSRQTFISSLGAGQLRGAKEFNMRDYKPRNARMTNEHKKFPASATSSLSAWTSEPSRLRTEEKHPRQAGGKVSGVRRMGDTLKFGGPEDGSMVSSSSSSISSWPTRQKYKPPQREIGTRARPRPDQGKKDKIIGRTQGIKNKNDSNTPSESYSSWATRGTPKTSSLKDDDNMFFIGGPLSSLIQKASGSGVPSSPDSQGTDSTPFEDILNRCKNKLEQLSADEEVSFRGKYTSFGSSSDIIDLVDHLSSDERTTRSTMSIRSGRTTRSGPANY